MVVDIIPSRMGFAALGMLGTLEQFYILLMLRNKLDLSYLPPFSANKAVLSAHYCDKEILQIF
jgi:hypothetical protein